MTTRDYLRLLWRRRVLMVLVVGVCVVGALVYSLTATRMWEGRAELVVNSDAGARTSILAAAPVLGLLGDSAGLLGTDLATQLQIIASRPCLEQAYALMREHPELLRRVREEGVTDATVESLPGLLASLPSAPPPALWEGEFERMWDTLLVSGVEDSEVIEVRCEAADPQIAADFINAVALSYLGRSLGDARAVARRSLRYIVEELADAEERLAEAEEGLRGFGLYAGTVELQAAAEQRTVLLMRLDEQAALAEARMRAQGALQDELERRLADQPERVVASTVMGRNPEVADLQRALAAAEAERVALLEEYQFTAAPVRAAAAKSDELRARLEVAAGEILTARDEQLNPVAQGLLGQVVVAGGEQLAASRSLEVLRAAVARVESDLAELPDEQIALLRLRREVALTEKIYLALKEKEQEFEITEKTKMPAASLVEHAIRGDKPVRPKPILNLAAALVAGALLGLLLVAAVEHFDEGLHGPERLADLVGAPVVAALGGADWRVLAAGGEPTEAVRETLASALAHMRAASSVVLASSADADGAAQVASALAAEAASQGTKIVALAPGSGLLGAQEMLGEGHAVYIIAHMREARSDDVVRLARLVADLGGEVRGAIATGGPACSAGYFPARADS